MQIIHKNQTQKIKNSEVCTAIEYPMDNKDINGAVVEITGRYPDKGRAVNLKCREMAYVIRGSGKIAVEGKEVKLNKGDLVLFEPGEKYFWAGNLLMFVTCTPAWYPEQHKEVE